MRSHYQGFLIRDWQPTDRQAVATMLQTVLAEYQFCCEPQGTDRDAFEVEHHYWATGGEFWVVEHHGKIVGTAGYYPIQRGHRAVEIRKMYLDAAVRGLGLGYFLLTQLESRIRAKNYQEIWIETASTLRDAVRLYERNGYQTATGIEASRCDRVYCKPLLPQSAPVSVR